MGDDDEGVSCPVRGNQEGDLEEVDTSMEESGDAADGNEGVDEEE